jgi:hypothetical protein
MARPLQQHDGPAGRTRAIPAPSGWPADIIDLVMADHRRIRRLCRTLGGMARQAGGSGAGWMLTNVWQRLTGLLEMHTRAEEEICYLPMFGSGPRAAKRRREAIADHDDLREMITEASLQRAGSPPWWRAVSAVLAATGSHLDREERAVRDGLAGLAMSQRRDLGRQWYAFIAAWTLDASGSAHAGPSGGGSHGKPVSGRRSRTSQM